MQGFVWTGSALSKKSAGNFRADLLSFASIRFDSVRFDVVRFHAIWFDSIRVDATRVDSNRVLFDSTLIGFVSELVGSDIITVRFHTARPYSGSTRFSSIRFGVGEHDGH